MRQWKLLAVEQIEMRPNQLRLVVEAAEPFVLPAREEARKRLGERFAEAIADCEELAVYRARHGQDAEMQAALQRLELQLQELDLAVKVAKADLSGEPLAKRLVKLQRDREAAEARVKDLRDGIQMFADDVASERKAAEAELRLIVHEVASEVYQEARGKLGAAQGELQNAIASAIDAVADLIIAARPMYVDQLVADGNNIWIRGALAGTLAPKPQEPGAPPRPKRARTPRPAEVPQAEPAPIEPGAGVLSVASREQLEQPGVRKLPMGDTKSLAEARIV